MPIGKRYLLTLTAVAVGSWAVTVAFNVAMDPLWLFDWQHPLNRLTPAWDERQQKSNRLVRTKEQFDGVLVGSSRATVFRERDFPGARIFNYSAPAMLPSEFGPFVDFFAEQQGEPRWILTGMDFLASRRTNAASHVDPDLYLDRSRSALERLRMLASLDMVRISARCLRQNWSGLRSSESAYERQRIRLLPPRSDLVRAVQARGQLDFYERSVYGPGYVYDPGAAQAIAAIRAAHARSDLVVFTTPTTLDLYRRLLEEGRFDDYRRWIGDLVLASGRVIDYMGVNEFTRVREHFYDANHMQPHFSDQIARELTGVGPVSIGRLVSRVNLTAHLERQRREARELYGGPLPGPRRLRTEAGPRRQ